MKKAIKKIIGTNTLLLYHKINAFLAAFFNAFPSRSLIVIGITGTKGKTSSAEIIHTVLQASKIKTGLISTAHFKIGDLILENKLHMTMPSVWKLQSLLKKIKNSGCTHVVMEVSSEGLKHFRHVGIDFDIACFTNLSPEHLPSHNNSYENYKKTKSILFSSLKKSFKKKNQKKVIITNIEDNENTYYSSFWAEQKITYGISTGNIKTSSYELRNTESVFIVNQLPITIHIPGVFNILNALLAYAVASAIGVSSLDIKKGIESIAVIPGRMERIDEGQEFDVFIDYAHEKLSMTNLLQTATQIKKKNGKIILLFGAEGGGRDKNKRKEMADVANSFADYIVLSNVDPYEDNPKEIINDIFQYISIEKRDKTFLIEDRRAGIKKCFLLAQPQDIILITGKGAELTMSFPNGVVPWDERNIVRNELKAFVGK